MVELVCPSCHGSEFRRSHRRTLADYLLSFGGIKPWRCLSCQARFRARRTPFRNLLYAHCRICGNLQLQRIAPEHILGLASIISRIFGVPAFRCVPCRNKFFSVKPLLREFNNKAAA